MNFVSGTWIKRCVGISCDAVFVGQPTGSRARMRSSVALNVPVSTHVDVIVDWDETCVTAFIGLGRFGSARATTILCLNAEL